MVYLEVGIHGYVSLKAFLANRTLEAQLRLELLLASGRGHLRGRGAEAVLRGCDALVSQLHEQISVHLLAACGGRRRGRAVPVRTDPLGLGGRDEEPFSDMAGEID